MTELAGAYHWPNPAAAGIPIRITGNGKLVIGDQGLVASAYKHKPNWGGFLGPMGGLFGGIALTTALACAGVPVLLALVPIIVGPIAGIVIGRKKDAAYDERGVPFTLNVPWSCVKGVQEDPHVAGGLVIQVHRMKPEGSLYFLPGRELRMLQLLADLRARAGLRG